MWTKFLNLFFIVFQPTIFSSDLVQQKRVPQPQAERGRADHQGSEDDRGGDGDQEAGGQPHEGGAGPSQSCEY